VTAVGRSLSHADRASCPRIAAFSSRTSGLGLDSAVVVRRDESAEEALSRLRHAGASLVVTVDADGRPQTVVPEKALGTARPGQQVVTCKSAWPAAIFIQPVSDEDARRVAAHNESQPLLGHRTVVVENGQIAGVVPVPGLIDRPGRTSRVLERLMWATGSLTMRVRYGRMSRSLQRHPPQPPSGSP
jgi:signal-transduction protein with cAMP-binding, CBS, and nucleotidyltransferase domain